MKTATPPTSRTDWLRGMATSKGYTLGRDDGGRYTLERDGMSKRYMSFGACLQALTTGKELPTRTHKPRPIVPEPIIEEVPEAEEPLAGYTLTPGDAVNGGGWWISDGKSSMWKSTSKQAEAAAKSGELARKLLTRSDAH